MASLFTNLQAAADVVGTLVRPTKTGLTSGEVTIDPANFHGHQGDHDIFDLVKNGIDFQLFRSREDITFIHGDHDTASFWGGGNQTVYDYGSGATLRFSELENAKVNVYGLGDDPTAKIVFFNAVDPTIQSDGQGGTLINNVDFFDAKLTVGQVSFLHSDTPPSMGGLIPL